MNNRDLNYFCDLVESGSYTATAEKFQITQPAVSAAVKRLEREYETPLLRQRNHRAKLVTTAAGGVLYIKARKMITEYDQVKLEVQHASEGQVRLGFSNIAGGIWLPRVVELFTKNNLLDQVTTEMANSEKLLTELRDGKLDAAVFSSIDPEKSTDLRVSELEKHQLCVLVNKHNLLSRQEVISPEDLRDVSMLVRPKHTLPRKALDAFCRRGKFRPKILYEPDTNQLVEKMVALNLGVGFVIDGSVYLDENVVKIPLREKDRIHCYMQLAVRKSFLPNQNQQQCIELLKRIARTDEDK